MFRRLLFITVTAFILTPAAASAGNVERWREDFAPVNPAAFTKYTAAMAAAYTPHVQGRGIAAVQAEVTATGYRLDGEADTWTPAAIWREGGDCEDLAIAKIKELAAQGFTDTYFAVLQNNETGEAHATVFFREGGKMFVLRVRGGDPYFPLEQTLENWTVRYFAETKTGKVYTYAGTL